MASTKLNIKRGTGRKKMLQMLVGNPELEDFNTFLNSITDYCSLANNTYAKLDGAYLSTLQLIRLLADGIYSVYGLLIVDNKLQYIRYFIENKPTNRLACKGEQLTTNVISRYIDEDYIGLSQIYKESCRYLHPSIFMNIIKHPHTLKEEQRGILTPKSIWETDHLKGAFTNKNKVAFIVDTLNNILYDVIMRAYNEAIAPLYPQLEPVPYKRNSGTRKNFELSQRRFIRYVNKATKRGTNYVNTISMDGDDTN
ncbi:MAG: hypothetical protein NC548_59855 [Lachnospiraceae bacterium]|nr:hypothetical protein [Lachnospiraceae bacterium]